MDVPRSVRAALDDRPVTGAVCLEAGAGVGNATAGLLDGGAGRVYALTDNRDHAVMTRERASVDVPAAAAASDRLAVLEADLRAVPLPDDSVGLVTAHALCNVLDPTALSRVADELLRVAAPGCHLVVDDYDPLPEAAAVTQLFAVENAAAELATGRQALTFYPARFLRQFFEGQGWELDRERTLLEPVPWTADHISAHVRAVSTFAQALPPDTGNSLTATADRLAAEIDSESAGRMYSIALRLPE